MLNRTNVLLNKVCPDFVYHTKDNFPCLLKKEKEMLEYIKKYWIEFLCTGLVTLCTALITKLKARRAENECFKSALRALLRDRIIGMYNRYTEKEFFPIYERENLAHLTAEYYALGGNGVIRELEEKLSEMPTEPHG